MPRPASATKTSAKTAARATSRGFQWSNVNLPRTSSRTGTSLNPRAGGHIPRKGEPPFGSVAELAGGDQAGLGQRPPGPRELAPVPAGQRPPRDALAGRVDQPAVAEVDAGVADRGRLGARAGRAEEEHVTGRELGEADPLGAPDLAAHLVRRAALDRRGEGRAAGVGLQLVDAPHEAGAVEAAVGLDAEGRLRLLARAAPDVREADEADGCVQPFRLPGGEGRQLEGRGPVLDRLGLPAAETQDARDR